MSAPMSEAERLALAAKLDSELDDFISSLPKRQPQEQVPFDRWEEDITNHPFFMKDLPQPGDQLHPLYEGLQKLKYDPEENEPEELASAYKDDGNFHFKHKKYRMAIISYTEGIKAKCGDADLEASLYNNRSAAHFFLRNYRSAMIDAEMALKFQPDHRKALVRAAKCAFNLQKFDKAIDFCDRLLAVDKNDGEALKLRQNCSNQAKIKERDMRKREVAAKKLEKEEEKVVGEILKRGLKVEGGMTRLSLSTLEPKFPQLFNSRVCLNEVGNLVWPVILFYPEYKIMDYIQQFDECNTFLEQLSQVFDSYPEWDLDKKYRLDNLNVYFENDRRENVKIDMNQTLLEVLKLDSYVIKEGTPKFIVMVAGSPMEKLFLAS